MRYAIQRNDGTWYIGTVDRRAVFSHSYPALYEDRDLAEGRLANIRKGAAPGESFTLVPAPVER